ncbi:MAG: alpha-amylase family glycosyl hydrolase [Prevotella sp.]|nr:alpha-amylase family glycosyl hydrolase [Prevotella sp.]MCH4099454.1 alpha-amylase family glycosyl hydrolase [Prevotella sp.]MCI1324229.1 alpha-amylase family glycosyl hydrolase [Prevotella sp.]MCI1685089.1 alpha-amylase family glycosyl hydrolase [Prevotella sp.]MCI1780558.1 alpha-amylase family glycosyl hydrolase [Prevotella sp.]
MKKKYFLFPFLAVVLFFNLSCAEDETKSGGSNPDTTITLQDGFNFNTDDINADQPLTITFKAPSGTALYDYSGDLYLYSGAGTDWTGAPQWTDNESKYKMTAVAGESNEWSITIPNSLRSFYGISSSTSLQILNLIVRNSDGTKQTYDYSIPVNDPKNGFSINKATTGTCPVNGDDREGIHINSSTSVTLVLYDQDKNGDHKDNAFVLGSFNDWKLDNKYQMKYDDSAHCWWITLDNLTSDIQTFEYFLYSKRDGGDFLCDPYSDAVLENGVDSDFPKGAQSHYVSVINTTPQEYSWQVSDFKMSNLKNPVIYELLLRDFTDQGTLAGALQKLDYLKALGVDAIELMPVEEFTGNDSWGYDTGAYFALDDSYGTVNKYKAFIDACHEKGMGVIFDVVYNHTTNDNAFARQYWDPYFDRPSAQNPWLNAVTPHQKYVFSPDDFNHQSAQTQEFVIRNLKFLLDTYHIDGFRFDFTKGFTQKQTTGDDDLAATDPDREAVLKKYYDAIKNYDPNAFVVMEHFCSGEESDLSKDGICFWRNLNNAFAQSAMGWSDNSDFTSLYDKSGCFDGYMESHDEERCAYKQTQWGNGALQTDLTTRMKQLETNAAFFFTVPGPKMIWQFEELGYDISIDENGRTGRKPTGWDDLNITQRKALHDTYAKLITLRHNNPDLFQTPATFTSNTTASNWADGRFLTLSSPTKKAVVAGNFTNSDATYTISFPADGTWYDYMKGTTYSISGEKTKIMIPANSYIIFTTFQ